MGTLLPEIPDDSTNGDDLLPKDRETDYTRDENGCSTTCGYYYDGGAEAEAC